MKFFNNLPKTVFTSSIGDFKISDFFTYLDVEHATIEEGTVTIDNKTTLLEAAYNVYTDSDSFWAIVAANNVINPFFLLEENAVLYIKNNDEWIKETDDKTNIKYAIKHIANKNIKQIFQWQQENPDYNNPKSKQNDKYLKILLNSMSGSTEEEQINNINKIIKNVAKGVTIKK